MKGPLGKKESQQWKKSYLKDGLPQNWVETERIWSSSSSTLKASSMEDECREKEELLWGFDLSEWLWEKTEGKSTYNPPLKYLKYPHLSWPVNEVKLEFKF